MESIDRVVPLCEMARRLHVAAKWLKAEALAGRLPHVAAGDQLLFHPKTIEQLLILRAAQPPARIAGAARA